MSTLRAGAGFRRARRRRLQPVFRRAVRTGIIRNHDVGRTFIQPSQSVRELGVRMKHSANRAAIEGKRIILIDELARRGTTSKKIVRMMRDAGAREVHFRLASPPILYPDYYGIDLPDRGGLLAARKYRLEEMRELIGAEVGPRRSCRSTACTAPWAIPAAIRPTRNSPTASPAPIRPA